MEFKYKKGKGVLAKDVSPFTARTLHAVIDGWNIPLDYTPRAMMVAFLESAITKIILIDEDNVEHTVEKVA